MYVGFKIYIASILGFICNILVLFLQGLRYHLNSNHDLFNFEFWVGKLLESS